MHSPLAFLNGAGARRDTGSSHKAFFEVLNLLCTTHRAVPVRVRAPRFRRRGPRG
jgi:hypothetical protein